MLRDSLRCFLRLFLDVGGRTNKCVDFQPDFTQVALLKALHAEELCESTRWYVDSQQIGLFGSRRMCNCCCTGLRSCTSTSVQKSKHVYYLCKSTWVLLSLSKQFQCQKGRSILWLVSDIYIYIHMLPPPFPESLAFFVVCDDHIYIYTHLYTVYIKKTTNVSWAEVETRILSKDNPAVFLKHMEVSGPQDEWAFWVNENLVLPQ